MKESLKRGVKKDYNRQRACALFLQDNEQVEWSVAETKELTETITQYVLGSTVNKFGVCENTNKPKKYTSNSNQKFDQLSTK